MLPRAGKTSKESERKENFKEITKSFKLFYNYYYFPVVNDTIKLGLVNLFQF